MEEILPRPKLFTVSFTVLLCGTFLFFFSTDFLIPVLPFYLISLGGGEGAVGLLMGLFTAVSIVVRPFQGRWADRHGRKRLFMGGAFLYMAAAAGLAAFPSLPALFFFRALQGIGWSGFIISLVTLVIDLAPPERRGEAVGVMGIFSTASIAVAPVLGETLLLHGTSYPALFMITVVAAFLTLPAVSPLKEPVVTLPAGERATPLVTAKVLLPAAAIFCVTLPFGGILTYLPLLGKERGITVGAFFTAFALVTMVVRPLAGALSDRWGRPRVIVPGLALLGVALVVIARAHTVPVLLAGAFFYGCGFGCSYPALTAMAADRLLPAERGVGMSTFTMAFDSGIAAGAMLLGFLLNWVNFTLVFLLFAMIMLPPLGVFLYRLKRGGSPSAPFPV